MKALHIFQLPAFFLFWTGEISGWIEVEMYMEENPDLFCSTPKPIPARPPDDFNTDIFQLHIARISSLIEDMNKTLNAYIHDQLEGSCVDRLFFDTV